MIEQIAGLFRYVFRARKNGDGTEWAENTIERFAAGYKVSDTELFYANRVLEMKPEKRGSRNYLK